MSEGAGGLVPLVPACSYSCSYMCDETTIFDKRFIKLEVGSYIRIPDHKSPKPVHIRGEVVIIGGVGVDL